MTLVERPRRRRVRNYLVGLVVTVLVLALGLVGFVVVKSLVDEEQTQEPQRTLAPLYVAPDGWEDASPGDVLRRERLHEGSTGALPADAVVWRVLYRSERIA